MLEQQPSDIIIPHVVSVVQAAKYARTMSEGGGGGAASRRTVGSLVGAVLQHDNEEEEGYDPRRPAIGNVASVIKVTDRRLDFTLTTSLTLTTSTTT